MKKLRIRLRKDETLECLCGNTEGFREDRSMRDIGIYMGTCLRCGIKFDDDTLEVVGLRLGRDLRNDLAMPYFDQIFRQSRRYFKKKNRGFLFP
jgi:hypothetical protein